MTIPRGNGVRERLIKHKDTKGTKTQRRPPSKSYLRRPSLCLCALCVFVPFVSLCLINLSSEDRRQLMRRNDLELVVGAVARFLVRAPSSELRGVTEPAALHVVVGYFDHQLGTQRFPGQILALAPAALGAGHTTSGLTVFRSIIGRVFPG